MATEVATVEQKETRNPGGQFVFDDHKLIHHLDRVKEWLENDFCMPLHLDISPSGACNVRCVYCLFRHLDAMGKQDNWIIPPDILIQLMKDASVVGAKSIAFVGDGEPFTNPATPEAIVTAGQCGTDIAVATNGILIKEEDLADMLRALTWIRFSLCAATPENYHNVYQTKPDNFWKMRQNMRRAVELKRELGLEVTIGSVFLLLPENADELCAAAQIAIDEGLDYFYVKQYVDIPENPYHFDFSFYDEAGPLLREVEEMEHGDTSVVVRWQNICAREKTYDRCLSIPFLTHVGSDSKCYVCAPKIGDADACYGDLRDNTLPEILNSQRYRDMLKFFAQDYDVHKWCPESCREDYMNRWLWKLKHPPQHVNFI